MGLSNNQLIEVVIRSVPYGDQCRSFDTGETNALRFTWRGQRFRVSDTCHVEEVEHGCLVGNNIAILMEAVLRPVYIEFLK